MSNIIIIDLNNTYYVVVTIVLKTRSDLVIATELCLCYSIYVLDPISIVLLVYNISLLRIAPYKRTRGARGRVFPSFLRFPSSHLRRVVYVL